MFYDGSLYLHRVFFEQWCLWTIFKYIFKQWKSPHSPAHPQRCSIPSWPYGWIIFSLKIGSVHGLHPGWISPLVCKAVSLATSPEAKLSSWQSSMVKRRPQGYEFLPLEQLCGKMSSYEKSNTRLIWTTTIYACKTGMHSWLAAAGRRPRANTGEDTGPRVRS